MLYRVRITETFKKDVYVVAEDETQAREAVLSEYEDGRIDPSDGYDDFDYKMEVHDA